MTTVTTTASTQTAEPPRPELGGAPRLPVLRARPPQLELLAIDEPDDASLHPIAAAPTVRGRCDIGVDPGPDEDDPCPPCEFVGEGVERQAYDITRSSGGRLWATWVTTDITANVDYELIDGECEGAGTVEATGTFTLAELGPSGELLQTFELELPDVNVYAGGAGFRMVQAAAFGERVAVLIQLRSNSIFTEKDEPYAYRLLAFDVAQ